MLCVEKSEGFAYFFVCLDFGVCINVFRHEYLLCA